MSIFSIQASKFEKLLSGHSASSFLFIFELGQTLYKVNMVTADISVLIGLATADNQDRLIRISSLDIGMKVKKGVEDFTSLHSNYILSVDGIDTVKYGVPCPDYCNQDLTEIKKL